MHYTDTQKYMSELSCFEIFLIFVNFLALHDDIEI